MLAEEGLFFTAIVAFRTRSTAFALRMVRSARMRSLKGDAVPVNSDISLSGYFCYKNISGA